MEDSRDAKSTNFLYVVGSVVRRLQLLECGTSYMFCLKLYK